MFQCQFCSTNFTRKDNLKNHQETNIECLKIQGKTFTDIVFNWRYLLDGLKALNGKDIILNLNGEVRPAMLRSANDDSLLYIAMPIKNS